MVVEISKTLNNINLDSVLECNLLCKLIIDYIPSNNIILENHITKNNDNKPNYVIPNITMEEGNFINFQDTSYLATKCFCFQPSRHLIDGERFDFEINIYHGVFDDDLGYSTHLHYHNDDNNKNSDYHEHLHYHKNTEEHKHDFLNDRAKKNVVLCLLFNRDSHQGKDVNIFFDQLIHSDKFNNVIKNKKNILKLIKTNLEKPINLQTTTLNQNTVKENIKTHNYFNFSKLLPKRRSFFQYDENISVNDKKTMIVFDSVQSISKDIIDKLINMNGFNIGEQNLNPITNSNVLYKKNIEVITDERYKKLIRLQIKHLLSLNRIIPALNNGLVSEDYYEIADNIYTDFNYKYGDFEYDMDKAVALSDEWENYSKGEQETITFRKIKHLEKQERNVIEFENQSKNLDLTDKYSNLKPIFDNISTDIDVKYNEIKETYLLQLRILEDPTSKTEVAKTNPEVNRIYGSSDHNKSFEIFKNSIILEILKIFKTVYDSEENKIKMIDSFKFLQSIKNKSDDGTLLDTSSLNKTIDGDNCQKWQSNEVHHEGTNFNILANTLIFNRIKRWNYMNQQEKYLLKDGLIEIDKEIEVLYDIHKFWKSSVDPNNTTLLKYITQIDSAKTIEEHNAVMETMKVLKGQFEIGNITFVKAYDRYLSLKNDPDYQGVARNLLYFKPHNKCRNPGNIFPGPWCYTKNPNIRWQYCVKPDYSKFIARLILLITFIFTVILSYIAVKRIFAGQYFSKFMALLTGTKLGEQGGSN